MRLVCALNNALQAQKLCIARETYQYNIFFRMINAFLKLIFHTQLNI